MTLDELEAMRLADLEGLYQEQAADHMKVSRQTFGRIVESARRKVAEALVGGKVLRIEGGAIEMAQMRKFKCYDCQHEWEVPYGTGRPHQCLKCSSVNIHRAPEDRVCARGGVRGQGRCFRGGRRPGRQPAEPPGG